MQGCDAACTSGLSRVGVGVLRSAVPKAAKATAGRAGGDSQAVPCAQHTCHCCARRWENPPGDPYGQNCLFMVNDWHAALVPLYLSGRFHPHGVHKGVSGQRMVGSWAGGARRPLGHSRATSAGRAPTSGWELPVDQCLEVEVWACICTGAAPRQSEKLPVGLAAPHAMVPEPTSHELCL